MAKALPEYPNYMPKDSPEDATLWADWLEGFVAMMGAMDIEEDAEAVARQDGQDPIPAKTRWFELLWHYLGKDTRKSLKKLDTNGVEGKSYKEAHEALTITFHFGINIIH